MRSNWPYLFTFSLIGDQSGADYENKKNIASERDAYFNTFFD